MYDSMAEQYLVEVMGFDQNDWGEMQDALDQVSIMSLQKCKVLVVALAQFMDFGSMSDPADNATDLEQLKGALVALQSRQLIDVVQFKQVGMSMKLVSVDTTGFFEPQWLLGGGDYHIAFQNHFDMYIDAYANDAHLRSNPAICKDGTISSSGLTEEMKYGKAKDKQYKWWQPHYEEDQEHARGVCTKHGGVEKTLTGKAYQNAFDPDGLVPYRSERHPKWDKAQALAHKKAKAKPKS
jgi:uncharacterized protein YodC (DUF2158 family)